MQIFGAGWHQPVSAVLGSRDTRWTLDAYHQRYGRVVLGGLQWYAPQLDASCRTLDWPVGREEVGNA